MQIQVEKLIRQLPELYSLRASIQQENIRLTKKMEDMENSINGKIKILEEKKNWYKKKINKTSEAMRAIEQTICGLSSLECKAKILNEDDKNVNN